MTHYGAFLEAAAAPGGVFGQYGSTILMIVVLVAVFYFFMIRPENKKKKQQKEMRDNLKAGDDIVTIGGIVGKVVDVSEEHVTFETSEDRVRVKVLKGAIQTVGKTAEPSK